MLFLITNQSNCFTLFVLKLGGDTKQSQQFLADAKSRVEQLIEEAADNV
jgi:hypothetical protein